MKKIMIRKLAVWISLITFLFFSTPLFAESSIWVDPSTGRITIKAPREKIEEIEDILPRLPIQPRQIEIEARIIEVSEEVTRKFGASLEKLAGLEVPAGTPGEGTRIGFGPKTLSELEEGKGSLYFTFYRLTQEERFEMILNTLLTEGKARLLSSPRVATLSGEVAGIYVTTEIPYLKGITYQIVDGEPVPVESYGYATVGIVLQVLPRIVGENLVEMSVIPLVGDYEITPEFGAQHPVFKRQISPTNVTIKDGESLVIGGLITQDKSKRVIGLPVLSHLPILGGLFRSEVEVMKEKNLLITVKPHILKSREIEGRVKKIFQLKYGLASEVAIQVRELLSPEGSIEINPKEAPANSILVRDREERMSIIHSFLNQAGTFEAQRREKTYSLTYTRVEQAKTVVDKLLSSRGCVEVEEKENKLIVEDGAYQISLIDSAISALEQHNSRFQSKTFQLSFLCAESAKEKIISLLSPQGTCEVVDETNLLVKDNNWVIEKVREKLEGIDTFNEQKEVKAYSLKYQIVSELIESASFQQALKKELSPQAKIEVKEETNELIVTEVECRQKKANELIKSFDLYKPVKVICPVKFWIASLLKSKLGHLVSPAGQITVDTVKNSLIIKDSPYNVKQIEREIKKLDTFEQAKLRRKITVIYLPLDRALEVARKSMSPQGRILQIEKDERSFILEEALYPLRKIWEELGQLDIFERQRIARFYELRYISGEDAQVVVKNFLSPEGKVYTGEGQILVIDAPYYQEKVKEILKVIDLPNNSSN